VFDSYGRKGNAELFLNYGFLCSDNECDQAEVQLSLDVSPDGHLLEASADSADPAEAKAGQERRRALLELWGGVSFKTLRIARGYDAELARKCLGFARLAVATTGELALLLAHADPALWGVSSSSSPASLETVRGCDESRDAMSASKVHGDTVAALVSALNLRNELAALRALAGACEQALASFPTSLEADSLLLADPRLSYNVRNCIQLRRCEKEVLAATAESCRRLLACAGVGSLADVIVAIESDAKLRDGRG
jgi:hypothetical protein